MKDTDDRQFDQTLAAALAADDPAAALESLARRFAGRPDRAGRIHQARGLIADLSALGERLEGTSIPPMGDLELPPARPVWRDGLLRWASAVAAAVLAVLLLWSAATFRHPRHIKPTALQLEIPSLTWRVPALGPVSLADQSFTLPKLSIPSTSSMNLTWTLPTVHLLPYSERSSIHETSTGA